ncbi:MAG: hypothetical protein FJY56_10845 [Betaproteobacteria bacterium]|nr:hypothetical protein [Betaproteobacteria bacterium]
MKQIARRWVLAGVLVAIAGALVWAALKPRRRRAQAYTTEARVAQFGARVDARLKPAFAALDPRAPAYPPAEIALVAFKDTRQLELYARASSDAPWSYIKTYAVQAASGLLGPKLQAGDRQVPEGIYAVEFLHPNSRFHVSLKLDYPNAFDRRMGAADGRRDLGSDIMIHGGAYSIGCLAMGDDAIEEIFVLAARAGVARVRVVICPTDFRINDGAALPTKPAWTRELYGELHAALVRYPRQA